MVFIIMKKFKIHYSFLLILLLAFLIGLAKEIIVILFVLLIHELGHLLFLKLFKNNISQITLYPFGGVIAYDNKNDFIYKAFLITSGGVIFNFLFYLIFKIMGLSLLWNVNLYFLFLNLIPIYPLDGGRLFILSLSLLLPLRLSKIIGYVTSIVISIVLGIILFLNFSGVYLLFFLFFFIRINITSIILIKKEYHAFLLMKYLNPNPNLKERETIFFTDNPVNSLFNGKNTIFNFKTFKVKEEVVLKKYFLK